MTQQVTISSITANTPVDIYYCDSLSANCQFVASAITFPYTFTVSSPAADTDFTIKIIDSQNCEEILPILITPTPTSSLSPTPTQTPTYTPSTTPTTTVTPSATTTQTTTPTITPTNTISPTPTPTIVSHQIGQTTHLNVSGACEDTLTIATLFSYINIANLVPVVGAVLYQTSVGGILYNPYNGGNNWLLMLWGGVPYAVQIGEYGDILDFQSC